MNGSRILGGKNFQIFKILIKNYLQPCECILIDDDTTNCNLAKKIGIKTYNVSEEGICVREFSNIMFYLFGKNCTSCFKAIKHSPYIDCDRSKSEELLKGQPVGKYIVRLVILQLFNVCVSYVNKPDNIVHSLLINGTKLDSFLSN